MNKWQLTWLTLGEKISQRLIKGYFIAGLLHLKLNPGNSIIIFSQIYTTKQTNVVLVQRCIAGRDLVKNYWSSSVNRFPFHIYCVCVGVCVPEQSSTNYKRMEEH